MYLEDFLQQRQHFSTFVSSVDRILEVEAKDAEILGDPYRRQVPLLRIPNNQAQDSTRDSAQPYIQTLGTYGQTKLG